MSPSSSVSNRSQRRSNATRCVALGALVMTGLAARGAVGAESYAMNSVVLLQPQEIIGARVSSVAELAAYVQSLNAAAAKALEGRSGSKTAGYIAVAVRPEGKAKIWLDFTPALPPELQRPLQSGLEAVAPVNVKEGLVLFAINASVGGAPPVSRLPQPPEWLHAAQPGSPEPLDQMVDRIWPTEPRRQIH
jgi:hypothetical protein